MMHHNVCPLCSCPEISHFLTITDHFVSKEVFEIHKCGKCGFIFTQDYPEESESGHYYDSEDYISHSDSKERITDKAYQTVRKIMLNKKIKIIRRETGLFTGALLDIGSGTGHFLYAMKKSGWDIKGVEISSKAREYASSIFNIETLPPESIEAFPAGSFDVITLWHVLEHFYDPNKLMNEIGRLLKPQGICFIALPNSSSYDALHYLSEWAAYDVPRHLWHFNPSTFSAFAVKNNFTIIKTGHLPFDVFYISIMSEKYRGSKIPLIKGSINGLIYSLKSSFNRSGSSSLIYILRKSGI